MKQDNITKTNVLVQVRRFIPSSDGRVIAPDGTKGFYREYNPIQAHNLLTDAGRDFLHDQSYGTGAQANGSNYIALTTDSTAPADGDTTLTGEITTGGLARAIGAVNHTVGTAVTTVQKLFTASALHTAVQKMGLFDAASSGTLVYEVTFTAVTLQINDQINITWSITLND